MEKRWDEQWDEQWEEDKLGMYRSMYFCLNSILSMVQEAIGEKDYELAERIIRQAQCRAEDIMIFWEDAVNGVEDEELLMAAAQNAFLQLAKKKADEMRKEKERKKAETGLDFALRQ